MSKAVGARQPAPGWLGQPAGRFPLVAVVAIGATLLALGAIGNSGGSSAGASKAGLRKAGFSGGGAMVPASTMSWPNASDTGVPTGTTLRNVGYITANAAGEVISGVSTPGITINAPNVTVKDSRIYYSSVQSNPYVMIANNSTGLVIEDSELDGGGPGGSCGVGIAWSDYTALRVNVHGAGDDAFKVGGSNVTIQDSYIHDLWNCSGNHVDGTQIQNGVSNVTINHNNYSLPSAVNSSLFLAPDLGPNGPGPVTIENNYFSGGGYTVYVVNGDNGVYIQQGVSLTNNVWGLGTWQYGPFDHTGDTPINPFCGNTFSDSSAFGNGDAGPCGGSSSSTAPTGLSSPPTPPSSALVVDKTVPAYSYGTTTTPAFSTSAPGEVLVAFVSSDGPSSGGQTVTVSGGSLQWTLVGRANAALGDSEVWKAPAPSTLTNVKVTSKQRYGGYDQAVVVVTFEGSAGTGSVARASASSGAPRVSLTPARSGSFTLAVGNDWDNAIARTPVSGLILQWLDAIAGNTFWLQASTGTTVAGAPVTLADSAPTDDRWNLVAVEVEP